MKIAFAAIALISAVRIASTYRVFSQTVDEPIHIDCGERWLERGDLDCDPEHPPLARIAFALIPHFEGTRDILAPGPRYRHDLFTTRVGNLPFFLLAMIAVATWASRLFGKVAGLVAAGLFVCLPPVLAHAGLATTDMAACATVASASLAFAIWIERPTIPRAILLGIAIAAGICSKYSFLLFFPVAAIVLLLFIRRTMPWRQVAVVVFIALIGTWSVFRFTAATFNSLRLELYPPSDVRNVAARYAQTAGYEWVRADIVERYWHYGGRGVDFVDWAKAAGYPSPLAGRRGDTIRGAPPVPPLPLASRMAEPFRRSVQWLAVRVPIPAPALFKGLVKVARHNEEGHPSFLFGQGTRRGWWFYFPVVLFFKTPVGFIALAIAGIALIFRQLRGEAVAVAIAPIVMLLPAMYTQINLGVRHLLPLYPFFAIAAAYAVVERWKRGLRSRFEVCAAIGWLVVASAIVHPNYLSYFNEAALGHPERIVVDSNLDWGQDLLRLADAVRQRRLQHLDVAYFGSADPARFLSCPIDELEPGHRAIGWIAISETRMAMGDYRWLEAYRPEREIGTSIRLYRVLH